MRLTRLTSLFLLFVLLTAALGCPPRSSRSDRGDDDDDDSASGDDDDATGDDDDATGDDDDATGDDDDATGDDDDATGDDDDATGDDDDATGDDDDDGALNINQQSFTGEMTVNGSSVSALFFFNYWQDMGSGLLECIQTVQVSGTASVGTGVVGSGCSGCNALLTFDESTAVDISNPSIDPDACDPATLTAAGADLGTFLLTSQANGGGEDFLQIALVHETLASAAGVSDISSSTSLADQVADSSAEGLELTHVGGILNDSNGYMVGAGLASIALSLGNDYLIFWIVEKSPAVNPYAGTGLDGDYMLSAIYLLQ